jgi:uncharacterized protein (DUF433 family)
MNSSTHILDEINKLDPVAREELFVELRDEFPATPKPWSISDFSGVTKSPNVCGGVARIIRTRIPVWTLERMRQLGVSEIDILRSYPSLKAVDLVQAWSYADAFRVEIEDEIRANEEE